MSHPTIEVECPATVMMVFDREGEEIVRTVSIDVKLAPLIEALWARAYSRLGGGRRSWAGDTSSAAASLRTVLGRAGLLSTSRRLTVERAKPLRLATSRTLKLW